jgi:hypothetical protein
MGKRIVVIQDQPDPASRHLLHAMANAYAQSALVAAHEVRRKRAHWIDDMRRHGGRGD